MGFVNSVSNTGVSGDIAIGGALNVSVAGPKVTPCQAAAEKKASASNQDQVQLNPPQAKGKVSSETKSRLDTEVQLLLLLDSVNKKLKEILAKQKAIQAKASTDAAASQIAEMRNGGTWQAVSAGVTGLIGVVGVGASGGGLKGSVDHSSQQRLLNSQMAETQEKITAANSAISAAKPVAKPVENLPAVKPPHADAPSELSQGAELGLREAGHVDGSDVYANQSDIAGFESDNQYLRMDHGEHAVEPSEYVVMDRGQADAHRDNAPPPLPDEHAVEPSEYVVMDRGQVGAHRDNAPPPLPEQSVAEDGDYLSLSERYVNGQDMRAYDNLRTKEALDAQLKTLQQALEDLGHASKKREGSVDLLKAMLGTGEKIFGSSFQTKLTFSNADTKEFGNDESTHDGLKQKYTDLIKALDDFMKQLVDLLDAITSRANQTQRSIAGVA
ncbi:YopD family type III secretion system translocon subunit [Pseudomonas entomophila]|uniref:YopD family type III secretion system translocon subunit n=1 Tax=Pseudomonas entomophila TaxID=312306 RepID=UPI001F03014F|nr:YopD family type III secretion system translocon subunit [Pseudomonas entomophila]MCG8291447.1 YopD family type III secretion system translocon subunit [Pseudomonas entomophila]